MTKLDELRNNPSILRLQEAIKEKIQQLKNDLKVYPSIFFMLPGVASKGDKNNKIKALELLQIRIMTNPINNNDKGLPYPDNTLDGETLELFRFAKKLMPSRFTEDEQVSLDNRNPMPRVFR